VNFTTHPYHQEESGGEEEGERRSRKKEGEKDDKAYHGDGVAVLLLAAHCCLLSFSFFACSDADRDRDTLLFKHTSVESVSPIKLLCHQITQNTVLYAKRSSVCSIDTHILIKLYC